MASNIEYGIIAEPSSYYQLASKKESGWKFTVGEQDIVVAGLRVNMPSVQDVTGRLWMADGTLLGSVTIGIVGAGWTEAYFNNAITLNANETYAITCYNQSTSYYQYTSSLQFNEKITYNNSLNGNIEGTFPTTTETEYIYPMIDIIIDTNVKNEYYKINKTTLTSFADQARRINGTTDGLTVDEMLTIFEGANNGIQLPTDMLEGLENGYDVMFYDENNMGLAFYSIKQGHAINPPIYNTNNWQTSDGAVASFPYTPTSDIIFYALNSTYADQLYEFYDVDKVIYPYLYLEYVKGNSNDTIKVAFAKSISSSNATPYQGTLSNMNYQLPKATADLTMEEVVALAMNKLTTLPDTNNQQMYDTADRTFYTNFDITFSNAKVYRLDE